MPLTPWMTIGSRGSPLALVQTESFRTALAAAHGVSPDRISISIIRTSGDRILDRSLADAGGKGLFTKELDAALIAGAIDCAVHSAKDLPTFLPEGVAIAGYRPREDARDVFVSSLAKTLSGLPQGATFGSASPRRIALALRARPDLRVELLRGNVETRLRKAESGEVGATVLALAGLKRLGLTHRATAILDLDAFPPAPGQGAVAVTFRAGDDNTGATLAPTFDPQTGFALAAERAFLAAVDGSCRSALAGFATVEGESLTLRGFAFEPKGAQQWDVVVDGSTAEAEALGLRAGAALLERLPNGFLAV